MKNIQSMTEGVWTEIKQISLTQEQKNLLHSKDVADKVAQQELRDSFRVEVSAEVKFNAELIYTEVKPTLLEGDIYQLIACDIQLEGSVGSGILNCRINEEHKQIRF